MDIKIYVLLFILFILVQSKPFINIISKINGTKDYNGNLNNYGLIVQGICLVIAYSIAELLVNNEYL